jgi:hypothetical protein
MSKREALEALSDLAVGDMLADIDIQYGLEGFGDKEAVVRAYQRTVGLPEDGWPGGQTMSRLWQDHKRAPGEIVLAAKRALDWPGTEYSQSKNLGLGESWMEEGPFDAGDCSDFACHCLGIPKVQFKKRGVLMPHWRADKQWLGAAVIASGAIGNPRPWMDALPGDLVAYGGDGAHVEVVVDVSLRGTHRALLQTIGCSHSTEAGSLKTIGRRHAIASRDRTSLWGRKNAVVVTPWWNERGEE